MENDKQAHKNFR